MMLFIIYFIVLLSSSSFGVQTGIIFPNFYKLKCKNFSGEDGICTSLKLCPKVLQQISKGEQIKHCGFKGKIPIVCCPVSSVIIKDKRSIAEEIIPILQSTVSAVQEIVTSPKINFECGQKQTIQFELRKRGKFGQIQAYPWMATIGEPESAERVNIFCSAVLISEKFLLTAAQCAEKKSMTKTAFARLGEHDYDPFVLNEKERILDVKISDVIFHPMYRRGEGYYNIALLRLQENVMFWEQVHPICLPWGDLSKKSLINNVVTIAGWSVQEDFLGIPETVLKEMNMTVYEPSSCQKTYSRLPDFKDIFPRGLNSRNIICAANPTGSSCETDSGGPMMQHTNNGIFELIGIIVRGFGCTSLPEMFCPLANVPTMQWIKETVFV